MNRNEIFAKRIKDMRVEKGITQDEMASVLNATRATISAYERAKVIPPFDKIKKIADYYRTSVDYLMGITNVKELDVSNEVYNEDVDFESTIKQLIDTLKNQYSNVKLDGVPLDEDSRRMLIASLQSSINVAELLKKGK